MPNKSRDRLPEWKRLAVQADEIRDIKIRDLFAEDAKRFEKFHAVHGGLLLDYSKQDITEDTLKSLIALARACDLEGWREQMFEGEPINTTENRAVLHTALRRPKADKVMVGGENVIPFVHETLEQMRGFCTDVQKEKKFKHVVMIGIGGSLLGPQMVCEALKPFSNRDLNIYFVSNVDGSDLAETLRAIEPERSLFVVASKTFTTQETMTNARSAKAWLNEKLGRDDIYEHFVAITQNEKGARTFGISPDRIFLMRDWIGGRYSLWSSIGLVIALAIGFENFERLLAGAHSMDRHFSETPLERNIPVLLGLIGVWQRNFRDRPALAVLPYDHYLRYFPCYIQQLDMESNGKSVSREGQPVFYQTGPVVFGGVGTDSQHAFFQLLHQGTMIVPSEFIVVGKTQNQLGDHHRKLISNAIGQTQALMEGSEDSSSHRAFDGNRPSITIFLERLDPYTLGMLLALYEHKVFVQGILWNINSFDQWGVELGKVRANDALALLDEGAARINHADSSTQALIGRVKAV